MKYVLLKYIKRIESSYRSDRSVSRKSLKKNTTEISFRSSALTLFQSKKKNGGLKIQN